MGLFDGLHYGHRTVIKYAVDIAHENNCIEPAVFTFETDTVTSKCSGNLEYIMSRDLKREMLESLGVRYIYSPDFMNFKNLTAEEFVTLVLNDKLCAQYVICGEDFRFGHGASSGVDDLKKLCQKFGIEVIVIPPVKELGDRRISSTLIREYIRQGDVETANKLLGYPFQFRLPVTYGNQIGRTISFPTINQIMPKKQILPKFGVYASKVEFAGMRFLGVTNVGVKPTVGGQHSPLAETFIIDFNGDLYGESVKVMLTKFIRPEKKFSGIDELMMQIKSDVETVKQINISALKRCCGRNE